MDQIHEFEVLNYDCVTATIIQRDLSLEEKKEECLSLIADHVKLPAAYVAEVVKFPLRAELPLDIEISHPVHGALGLEMTPLGVEDDDIWGLIMGTDRFVANFYTRYQRTELVEDEFLVALSDPNRQVVAKIRIDSSTVSLLLYISDEVDAGDTMATDNAIDFGRAALAGK